MMPFIANKSVLFVILLCLLSSAIALAQPAQSAEEVFAKAEQYFDDEDFVKALTLYELVYAQYPESDVADDALFMKGMTEMRLELSDESIVTFDLLKREYPESDRVQNAELNIEMMRQMEASTKLINDMKANISAALNQNMSRQTEVQFSKSAKEHAERRDYLWSGQSLYVTLAILFVLGVTLYLVIHKCVSVHTHRKRKQIHHILQKK